MSTYSAGVLALSPLLYWRLGDAGGSGTVADASGNGRTGTVNSGVTLGVTGLLTGDADTAASSSGVILANISSSYTPWTASSQRSYLGLAKLNTFSPASGVPNRLFGGDGNVDPMLTVNTDSSVTFDPQSTAGGGVGTWAIGAWPGISTVVYWALAFDDSAHTAELFINGVSLGLKTGLKSQGSSTTFRAPQRSPIDGAFDEIAITGALITGAQALDLYQRGTLTGSYGPPVGTRTVLPPLSLSVEVTLADGSRQRWDSDTRAADRPQGLQFRTRQGDGFSDASCTLSRRIDRDYIDLNLLDDIAFIGDDGTTAYEGRVAGIPRSFGDMHSVSVNCAGWMAHARDRKFTEIYVDRDTGDWGDMPLNRKVGLAAGGFDLGKFSWTQEGGGLVCSLPNEAIASGNTIAETWYIAPSGVTIAKVMYVGNDTSLPASWEAPAFFNATADDATGSASVAMTFDGTLRTSTPANPRRYSSVREYSNGTAGSTPAAGTSRRIKAIGMYGNHGLTTRTIDSTTPDGLYASDVITNIAQRFCPRLSTAGVQATTFPISHLVFKDPTDPYDAFLDVNKYHLWDLGVWENKTLTFRPNDLSDYDWEIRLSDLGTTIDLQGDSADDLANGIVVNYTDVATGQAARLTPTDDTTLADTSTSNPVNTHGLTKWTELTLSAPTTAAAAAQIGRIALAEFNLPKAPGTITVTGHIKDRVGHWQQGWRVRAGDTVAITDHPNDRPRLVTETTWDHDSKTLTISVEGPAHRLDAVLDRITTDLVAANLS